MFGSARAGAADFNARRFKELVLYLASQSTHDPGFGSTKLNNLTCLTSTPRMR